MSTTASWLACLNPASWLGPIFVKELRVSSRRQRNYWLRMGYLGLLTVFAAFVWVESMARADRTALGIYTLPQVGQNVTVTIAWFQFVTLQLVAVVVASSAISDEIYLKTIHALLSTPITSLQIVLGKLLSRLLLMLILLATTLPLLAAVRIFGGVPWDFLAAATCVTLTASLFAGSVSLFYSILFRRAYVVIMMTLVTGAVLYLLLPMLLILVSDSGPRESIAIAVLHVNPPACMMYETMALIWARGAMGGPWVSWPLHCGLMLGGTVGVLALCVALVRRACRQAAEGGSPLQAPPVAPPLLAPPPVPAARIMGAELVPTLDVLPEPGTVAPVVTDPAAPPRRVYDDTRIRRVGDNAVLWRELHGRLLQGGRGQRIFVGIFVGLVVLLYLAIAGFESRAFSDDDSHVGFILAWTLLALISVGIQSATSITTEKETRSLPILLCTPLDTWQIVWAKAMGVLRRSLLSWGLAFAHVGLFVLAGMLHPVMVPFLFLLALGTGFFLICTGTWVSTLCRKTTTAVILNLLIGLVLWGGIPLLTVVTTNREPGVFINVTNPLINAGIATAHSPGSGSRGYRYHWSERERSYRWGNYDSAFTRGESLVMATGSALGYVLAGLGFLALASMSLRQRSE